MAGKTIAIVLPNMGTGGTERVALRLIRSLLDQGHRVDLVLMQKVGALLAEVPPEVEIVDLKAARIRNVVRPLADYLKGRRPDAVQARLWPLTVAAIIARRLARSEARLVVSDHAVMSRQYAGQPLTLALLRLTTRLFYPLADARLLVARAAADDLARLSGIPRDRFDVVYNPVDEPPPDVRSSPEVETLWGDAEERLITVGSLKPQKNHALLIRSFARVRQQRVAAKLMLVGTGPLQPELKRLASELGLDDAVIFAGHSADPWPYYTSADLFVLSSDYEGYPNVLVEAMRCGVPVVSTDCESGPREILAGERFGPLVPVGNEAALADAMDKALRNPARREELMNRAEELSGPATARRYLELLLGDAGG